MADREVIFALPLLVAHTVATPCPPAALTAADGSVTRAGASCTRYIVTTNGTGEPWSWGSAIVAPSIEPPFTLAWSWRRLSTDGHRSIEVWFPGGVLLVQDGRWGFYQSEFQFERDGWRTLDGFSSRTSSRWRLEHRGSAVVVFVDDARVGELRLEQPAPAGELSFALKGLSNLRSSMMVEAIHLARGQ